MLFNSFVFLGLFLPITYVVFWSLRTASARYVWLTVTGYVFYGYWNPKFCFVMAFSTLVSYAAGRGMLRWTDPRRRRLCLVIPITTDLALLGFFKYVNLLLDTVRSLAHALGGDARVGHLDIVLPVGISFYTFHTITYIVDSYRGTIKPTRNFFEFSTYVSLFSQLVAGPIVRFRQIEDDLEHLGQAARTRWLGLGISYVIIGLVETVVVADSIAALVNPAVAQYTALSTWGVWLAVLGYTFQLYFDFAGYSDMARGLGFMFGLRIPVNFNSPYKARDPADFWRRWHISLSSCLRDYLWWPLTKNVPMTGGWRIKLRSLGSLLVVFLLCGLWHGANWTFVVWGGYHGLLLVAHRLGAEPWNRIPETVQRAATFLAAVIGWVLFRSPTFGMAAHLLHTMFSPTGGALMTGWPYLAALLAVAAWWGMIGLNAQELHKNVVWRPARLGALAVGAGACLALMLGSGSSPFLYFQF